MIRRLGLYLGLCLAWGFSSALAAAEFEVLQQDKSFNYSVLEVKQGDRVAFKNADRVSHNVFSLSPTLMFDLGTYPKGESRTVQFDKKGEVDIECAIHPYMKMKVIVK